MPKVTLEHSKESIELGESEDLLTALKRSLVPIKNSCGGHASCGDCVVKVLAGEETLSSMELKEKQYLGNVFFITKERLACQLRCQGDLEVKVMNLLKSP